MNKLYNIYQAALIIWATCFILCSWSSERKAPADFSPLYRDAIKAVDPLEILKKGVGSPSDRAEF